MCTSASDKSDNNKNILTWLLKKTGNLIYNSYLGSVSQIYIQERKY